MKLDLNLMDYIEPQCKRNHDLLNENGNVSLASTENIENMQLFDTKLISGLRTSLKLLIWNEDQDLVQDLSDQDFQVSKGQNRSNYLWIGMGFEDEGGIFKFCANEWKIN